MRLYEHHDDLPPTLPEYRGLNVPLPATRQFTVHDIKHRLFRFVTVASGMTADHWIRIVTFPKQSWHTQCSDESLTETQAEPQQSGYAPRTNTNQHTSQNNGY
jgi:hypothetical protein